jgi:hypothetical protein
MESTTQHPAEIGNRRALVAATVAHLDARTEGRISADLLADLDADGWAIVQQDMGRTRPFSDETAAAIVAEKRWRELAAAAEIDDPFEGVI